MATYGGPTREGSGCAPSPVSALGRLSSVSSLGDQDVLIYGRGRPTCTSWRAAKPGPAAVALADRYALGWFTSPSAFDAADRPTSVTTGAISPELKKEWVVYAKTPFGGPAQVFNYLGRYTHRVAILNQRLLTLDEDGVRLVTRGEKTATLAPHAIIGRLLQYVLPHGFVKIDTSACWQPATSTPSCSSLGVSYSRQAAAREQGFSYDWLGNTISTRDDARGFYDRSLGTITNGTAAGKPYQLLSASNVSGSAPAGREGWLQANYDEAGNMVGLAVVLAGPCLPSGASCTQRFAYEWDEVGNLARARRWDLAPPSLPSEPVPAAPVSAELRNLYDNEGNRVVKTAVALSGAARHAVYALQSLELRGATYAGNTYERSARTEVPYLFAHGKRLARVVFALEDVPFITSGGKLHVLLTFADQLGSISTVIDFHGDRPGD